MFNKYSEEDDGGGFEEEYIDDDYDDVKPKSNAPVKKDFWEPPKKQPTNNAAPLSLGTKPSLGSGAIGTAAGQNNSLKSNI